MQSVRWIFLIGVAAMGFGVCRPWAKAPGTPLLRQSDRYERYLAVDNACGWPLVNRLRTGAIVMYIWPYPNHGATVGAMQCWDSTDAGRHWRLLSTPVPNKPGDGLANFAGGIAADGSLVVVVGGTDKRFPPEWVTGPSDPWPTYSKDCKFVPPVPAVSRDGGHTWRRYAEIPPSPKSNGHGYVPYGQIAPVPDGVLGVMMYDREKSNGESSFFVSADGGASWKKRGQISAGPRHNETTWIRLSNGDLFAAARVDGDRHLEGFRSTDNGRIWKSEGALSLPNQHPANLISLPDGRILLSYGVRNAERRAIDARVGDSTGRNWSESIEVVDLDGSTDGPNLPHPTRDGGYPSTIALPDGTLLTAFYSRGTREHQRYHVGVVKWVLPSTP